MMDNEPNSDLERQGVDLTNQGRYYEARGIFERVLTTKAVPLHPCAGAPKHRAHLRTGG